MGDWKTLNQNAVDPAPNVTAATSSITYRIDSNRTIPVFDGTFTIPAPLGTLYGVEIYVLYGGKWIQIAAYVASQITGGTPLTYSGFNSQIVQTSSAQTGLQIKFICYNTDGVPTATPFTLTSITIAAGTISSLSGTDSIGNRWPDADRLVRAPQGITIACSNYPQIITQYIVDPAATHWHGWFQIDGPMTFLMGLRGSKEIIFAPLSIETWTPKAAIGTFDSALAIGSVPNVFPGSGYSVAKAALPSSSVVTSLTPGSGAGGSFPFNKTTEDGMQYFSIPASTYSDLSAVADPNTFFIRITAQDYDASGNAIGPEQAFAGTDVTTGLTQTTPPLEGEYGSVGYGYTRLSTYPTGVPTNIAKIRLRVYAINRLNQSSTSFTDAAASTLQTSVGGGAGYVDVTVASGGAVPDKALQVTGDSVIHIPNAKGAVSLDSTTEGVEMSWTTGGQTRTAKLYPNFLLLEDGTGNELRYTSGLFSLNGGKLAFDTSGKASRMGNNALAGFGVPAIVDYQEGPITTNTTVVLTLLANGTTPPAGYYRITLRIVVITLGSGGAVATCIVNCADGGALGVMTFIQNGTTTLGTSGPFQGSHAPLTVYSNGSGISVSIPTFAFSGGAQIRYYVTLEALDQ